MHATTKRPGTVGGHDVARHARRLRELRLAILARVVRSASDLPALAEDVDAAEHAAHEAATAGLLLRLDELERRELAAIDAACARIERGTYGRCTSCGGAISAARLEILPDAAECVDCARGVAAKARSAACGA